MAVAKNQVQEIISIVENRVGKSVLKSILADLSKTRAYEKNRSFRDAVDRCSARVQRLSTLDQDRTTHDNRHQQTLL